MISACFAQLRVIYALLLGLAQPTVAVGPAWSQYLHKDLKKLIVVQIAIAVLVHLCTRPRIQNHFPSTSHLRTTTRKGK